MKRTLIVTMRMVIWRPCRQIEFDFGLMLERPKPFTTVKWVDDAMETWSKSLAFGWCWIASCSAMLSIKWFWECWAVDSVALVHLCECGRVFDDFSCIFVKFSKFATLKSSDDALWMGKMRIKSSKKIKILSFCTHMQTIDSIRWRSLRWSWSTMKFFHFWRKFFSVQFVEGSRVDWRRGWRSRRLEWSWAVVESLVGFSMSSDDICGASSRRLRRTLTWIWAWRQWSSRDVPWLVIWKVDLNGRNKRKAKTSQFKWFISSFVRIVSVSQHRFFLKRKLNPGRKILDQAERKRT